MPHSCTVAPRRGYRWNPAGRRFVWSIFFLNPPMPRNMMNPGRFSSSLRALLDFGRLEIGASFILLFLVRFPSLPLHLSPQLLPPGSCGRCFRRLFRSVFRRTFLSGFFNTLPSSLFIPMDTCRIGIVLRLLSMRTDRCKFPVARSCLMPTSPNASCGLIKPGRLHSNAAGGWPICGLVNPCPSRLPSPCCVFLSSRGFLRIGAPAKD